MANSSGIVVRESVRISMQAGSFGSKKVNAGIQANKMQDITTLTLHCTVKFVKKINLQEIRFLLVWVELT